MEIFIWENYNKDEVNEKIKYWVDLWEDLILYFNVNSYGLKLINPQLILLDVIDEIESNQFLKNKENKRYFYEKINEILKIDEVIKKYFFTEFTLIGRNFDSKRTVFLSQLCKKTLSIFRNGEYFKKSFQELKDIILEKTWNIDDERKISYLSQVLIIELLLKSYSLQEVKDFPKNIFDKYSFHEVGEGEKIIITRFPHGLKREEFIKGEVADLEAYNNSLKEELNNLTIEKRLDSFISYYNLIPEIHYYIFQVEGLKGPIDINFGDVNLYSPSIKKYIKESPDIDSEYFGRDKLKHYINAAVKVNTVSVHDSKDLAIEMIEKTLDLLRLYYSKSDVNFKVLPKSYIVVDQEGVDIGGSFGYDKTNPELEYAMFLDLYEIKLRPSDEPYELFNKISQFLYKTQEEINSIEKKICLSLHWFRKAEETNNLEDKLLNYWIVIENIFNGEIGNDVLPEKIYESEFSKIREILSYIEISNYIYQIGWEFYNYIKHLYNSSKNGKRILELPEDIAKKCKLELNFSKTIFLKDFIANLSFLENSIEQKIIKEKLFIVKNFYSDSSFAKEHISEQIKNLKDDLLLVYRLRNKIIHKAHHDNRVLPYYVEKIKKYSSIILREVLEGYHQNNRLTLEEILLKKYIQSNIIIEKLEKDVSVDFFNKK